MEEQRPEEWIGARIPVPRKRGAAPEDARELLLWVELPEPRVVGRALVAPGQRASQLGDLLLEAMAAPLSGAPRRPQRVRVADAALARELEGLALPEVVVAPTPELDVVLESLETFVKPSFYADSDLSAQDVEALFVAARSLWSLPWASIGSGGLIGVDMPTLEFDQGCAILINAAEGVRGLVLFANLDEYRAMLEDGARAQTGGEPTHSALYLTFDTAAELPVARREEVEAHRWPLADRDAYPSVSSVVAGEHRLPDRREVRLVTLAARALGSLAEQHPEVLEQFGEHLAKFPDADAEGNLVLLTVPHPQVDIERDQAEPPPRASVRPGVEDPYQLSLPRERLLQLERVLGDSAVHRLIGTCVALASVPVMQRTSEWMPALLGDAKFSSEHEQRAVVATIIEVYNLLMERLREEDVDQSVPEAANAYACRAWARGYAEVLRVVDRAVFDDTEVADSAFAIEALAEQPDRLARIDEDRGEESREDVMTRYREDLADDAALLYEAWEEPRQRAMVQLRDEQLRSQQPKAPAVHSAPKVGRNDPCTCGSGKKYKKCCGAAS